MTRNWQIALITLGCLGTYFIMRSLPVEECSFLHYGDYVNSEGVIEGCGYEETEFFVMENIRFPIIPMITPLDSLEVGKPARFEMSLFTTTGKPIRWEAIAVSHTERIHAMVVDGSLDDYHHLHPQPTGPDGHYTFEMTPNRPGPYSIFLDFIPLVSSRRTLLASGFTVPGDPVAPQPGHSLEHREAGLTFTFVPVTGQALSGKEARFRLTVKADDRSPTRFAPVMDAYAHVVAFDEEGSGFAHLHPQNTIIEGQDPYDPDLEFAFFFEKPGYYRVWAQMVINERPIFAPFDLMVL